MSLPGVSTHHDDNSADFQTGVAALPRLMTDDLIAAALREDLGRAGDITSAAVVPADAWVRAAFVARETGVVAGLDIAARCFAQLDPAIEVRIILRDGTRCAAGDTLAVVEGDARAVLGAERVALNLLCHLSGIATATRHIVDAIAGTGVRLSCTRKTMPGMRALQKYAVRCGGGVNHRFGLDDAILIKDNHIAIAGGVGIAVRRARAAAGHLVKIECEVDSLAQLDEALGAGVDAVLLDNMDVATLREAVTMIGGRAIAEASGRITPETAPAIAATGIDLMSAGWLTHSVRALDIGLDFVG